jgi:hypothetical protein
MCSNADSPTRNRDGEVVFVKPWEEQQDFGECIDFIAQQERDGKSDGAEVRYCQTRQYFIFYFDHPRDLFMSDKSPSSDIQPEF